MRLEQNLMSVRTRDFLEEMLCNTTNSEQLA